MSIIIFTRQSKQKTKQNCEMSFYYLLYMYYSWCKCWGHRELVRLTPPCTPEKLKNTSGGTFAEMLFSAPISRTELGAYRQWKQSKRKTLQIEVFYTLHVKQFWSHNLFIAGCMLPCLQLSEHAHPVLVCLTGIQVGQDGLQFPYRYTVTGQGLSNIGNMTYMYM